MIINQRKKVRLPGKLPKKPFPIGKAIYYFALLSFISSIIYTLFFSSLLMINRINIYGAENLSESSISGLIRDDLQGKYLNYINRNNIMFVGKRSMEGLLRDNFGRIKSVSVEKKFPSTLEVSFKEKQLMFFVCSAGECFILDREGNFNKEGDFKRDRLSRDDFIILNDLSGNGIILKEDWMEQDYIDYVSGIRDAIRLNLDINIGSTYETPSRVSSDIRVMTMEGWKIFFNKDVDMKKSLDILKLFLEEKIEDNQRKNLEYIDLRSDNKVYYKFREGTEIVAENKTDENGTSVTTDDTKKKKKK